MNHQNPDLQLQTGRGRVKKVQFKQPLEPYAPDQALEKSAFICMSGSHQRVEGEERRDTQQ